MKKGGFNLDFGMKRMFQKAVMMNDDILEINAINKVMKKGKI